MRATIWGTFVSLSATVIFVGIYGVPLEYGIADLRHNLIENKRVHLRLASRKSVKNETHKYVVFILVGSCGTCGQRKCTMN